MFDQKFQRNYKNKPWVFKKKPYMVKKKSTDMIVLAIVWNLKIGDVGLPCG